MKKLYALVLGATLLACASVQPVVVQAGDTCLGCRRAIGDVRIAAEMIDGLRAPFPFRTPACMARYVKGHPDHTVTALFVTDRTSGKMLPARDAWFVPTVIPVPGRKFGENDYAAFRSKADADAFRAGSAAMLRWAQVVAEVTE
jgi:hypothetical protein